jgi:uroporphyrin-III C-methyltransferase / precorrin-2 dehydrogenase / sirohydrochlorin ferrochelatase
MEFLPINLNIRDRDCLVVGGGEVAARKAGLLCRAGGRVTVVAPALAGALETLRAGGEITYREKRFESTDLASCVLAIAATDDETVNTAVAEAAQARGIPVNVADRPELCTFILPSIVDRSPLLISVSSGGASPVLARTLRARLEALIPNAYGRLAELARRYRPAVRQRFASGASRRRFWEHVFDGPIAELVLSGRERAAAERLEAALREPDDAGLVQGEVWLIGAGPGDPDLLTFRALRLMQRADVVLYDRLVMPGILDLVRREAERIYVGKKRDYHAVRQEEINRLLIEHARAGKRVVRLKGGDPFVFGRGGEEIATLMEEGIPFQVVPGITAANGCAAYAGIPLTHRDYAQSVVFVTGQLSNGTVQLDWPRLVQPRQTLVVYMGLSGLEQICAELVRHGMKAAMPAALIGQGTTEHQRVIIGTLETLPALVAGQEIHAPTLLIVGEVVTLHDRLSWFEPAG